jgi:hypothetical protein
MLSLAQIARSSCRLTSSWTRSFASSDSCASVHTSIEMRMACRACQPTAVA